jgi:hypothetical protein
MGAGTEEAEENGTRMFGANPVTDTGAGTGENKEGENGLH